MLFCVLLLDVLHETRKHLDEYGYRMFMKKCFSNMANIEHEMEVEWRNYCLSCIHKSLVTSTCFPKYIISSNNFDRKTNNNWINWTVLDIWRRKCKMIRFINQCLYHCIILYQIPSKKYETKYFSCRTTYWSSYCFLLCKKITPNEMEWTHEIFHSQYCVPILP